MKRMLLPHRVTISINISMKTQVFLTSLKIIYPLQTGKYKFLYSRSTTDFSDSKYNRQFFVTHIRKMAVTTIAALSIRKDYQVPSRAKPAIDSTVNTRFSS